MQYRNFGKLDWQVSALGFGMMRLPTIDGVTGNIDQQKTDEMVHTAIEGGVNYFDTAYVYHDQRSEAALGKALGSARDKVRIATKSAIWLLNDGDGFQRQLDEQLERLQTDHIDFYLLHALNKGSFENKVKKLDLIKESEKALADGRIKHIGFSFHDSLELFKEIIDFYDKWDFCQIQYNYMDTEFQAGTEGLKYAAERDIAVVIMESLRGGKLAQDLPATRPIWEIAPEKRTPADWAFQWLWNQPEVAVTLSGMSTLEQVKQNIESADKAKIGQFGKKELGMFMLAKEAIESRSPIPCTRCEYCMPCPNGVNIPRNFDVYNEVAMYEDIQASRFMYNNLLGEAERAAQCIQCDECLDKCPQHIQISDWMPVIEEVLGKNQDFVASL
jgi:uncharacterized protein